MFRRRRRLCSSHSKLSEDRSPAWRIYLMGPYNAGPKSALFLRVAEIRAGVERAGVKRAVFGL